MKKLILVLAALSLTSLAYAQGSEKNGFSADFSVVSRLEANPWIDFSGSTTQTGIDMGSSSLYFQGDGQLAAVQAFGEIHVRFPLFVFPYSFFIASIAIIYDFG